MLQSDKSKRRSLRLDWNDYDWCSESKHIGQVDCTQRIPVSFLTDEKQHLAKLCVAACTALIPVFPIVGCGRWAGPIRCSLTRASQL